MNHIRKSYQKNGSETRDMLLKIRQITRDFSSNQDTIQTENEEVLTNNSKMEIILRKSRG